MLLFSLNSQLQMGYGQSIYLKKNLLLPPIFVNDFIQLIETMTMTLELVSLGWKLSSLGHKMIIMKFYE